MTVIEREAHQRVGLLQGLPEYSGKPVFFAVDISETPGQLDISLLDEQLEALADGRAGFAQFMVMGHRLVFLSPKTRLTAAHEALTYQGDLKCAGRVRFNFAGDQRDEETGALKGRMRELFGNSRKLIESGSMTLKDWNHHKKVVLPQALGGHFKVS